MTGSFTTSCNACGIALFAIALFACSTDPTSTGPADDVADDSPFDTLSIADTAADVASPDSQVLESDVHDTQATSLPAAAIHGTARIFGPPGGPLVGARVGILEHPDIETVTADDGTYSLLSVPAGDVTLFVTADGFVENQLATHTLAGVDVEDLDFQAVSDAIFGLFGQLAGSTPDPNYCQVSSTVTRWFESSLPTVHGEPEATVSIEPEIDASHGPVYFNEDVLPTPGLTETTVDGGVVWTNVPPGSYVIRAHKLGVDFEEVRIRCRAGVLVNAAPPHGLQALNIGGGY